MNKVYEDGIVVNVKSVKFVKKIELEQSEVDSLGESKDYALQLLRANCRVWVF